MAESLDFIAGLEADYIIPGHGPVVTKKYLATQSAFIREWVDAVADGIARGWSKPECIEHISFLDRYPVDIGQEERGPAIQKWNVTCIYDYLKGVGPRFQWRLDF